MCPRLGVRKNIYTIFLFLDIQLSFGHHWLSVKVNKIMLNELFLLYVKLRVRPAITIRYVSATNLIQNVLIRIKFMTFKYKNYVLLIRPLLSGLLLF